MRAVAKQVRSLTPDLVQLRRRIHRHPEVAFTEYVTTDLICETLAAAGIRFRRFEGTGLVAEVGAEQPSYRTGLRADIDALPIPERSGLDFASEVPNVTHACGHDVHTTAVLGALLALHEHQDALALQDLAVRAVFQPAEEVVPGGAHQAIEEHALDGVDRIFAVHCDPSIDVGTVGLASGPITAACDSVHVMLSGRGGHTSRPHLSQDITFALGKVLVDLPAVLSRRLDPRSGAALVWGEVHSGNAVNVIPVAGEAHGTLRVLDAEVWKTLDGLVEKTVHELVAPYRVRAEVRHVRGVPPVVNDAAAIEAFRFATRATVGRSSVVPTKQSLGGEDFSWMLRDCPGAMARLGTRTPGGSTYELHQGDLVVDERAIGIGARILAGAALRQPATIG
ncbi:amidohydrolase [Calidifontibacter sp. DB0510]|uniref:Amidohydrolase n=1 Tax=Metallococcus carri TaxID=1656884 RepID=A0A967B6M8_9MICO|nr:amidohydrolase [Metallococcus carri]NOP38846.1 amidohydrolase [Calidifontibacter sp. DB2511S]